MDSEFPQLAGRRALVTGTASGIGLVLTKRLVSAGASVVGVDLSASPPTDFPSAVDYRSGDVSDGQFVRSLVEKTSGTPPFDILFHCAAVPQENSLLFEVSEADWRRNIDVNVTGSWLLASSVIPGMIEVGRGAVVLFASTSAFRPRIGAGVYSVAKTAVLGLTRALAHEVAPHGISVNAVVPGATLTPTFVDVWGQGDKKKAVSRVAADIPAGRAAEPDDVARAALFVATQPGAVMTGTSLIVDGGYTIASPSTGLSGRDA